MIYLQDPHAPASLQHDEITKRVYYVYHGMVVIPVVTELGTPSAKHAPDGAAGDGLGSTGRNDWAWERVTASTSR